MTDGTATGHGAVEPPQNGEALERRCEICGAPMRWDPGVDALSCAYCATTVPVPRGEGTVLERALDEAGDAARGLGLDVRVVTCRNCGARVAMGDVGTAASCVYCGSGQVLAQEANRNALRPESIVPLLVSHDEVRQGFVDWIGGLWFRPSKLKHVETFEAVGVYVPFWTYDARVHSEWSADAGHYYYVTEMRTVVVNGKLKVRPERVRKVRWEPAWGQRDDAYDDLLVHASRGVSTELVTRLGGFDTTALVPYRPDYLAGWRAEEYQLDLHEGWEHAQRRIEERQRSRCAGDVPGDTQRRLEVRNRIADVRWKHVLLPLWSLSYRFGGETYTVLVNGQTGRIAGEAPYSWVKITLAVLAGAAAVAAVFVAAN